MTRKMKSVMRYDLSNNTNNGACSQQYKLWRGFQLPYD